jgi:hypothetical protein
MEYRIFTIGFCGKMKIHIQFFHHVTNSGSPLASGPICGYNLFRTHILPNRLQMPELIVSWAVDE